MFYFILIWVHNINLYLEPFFVLLWRLDISFMSSINQNSAKLLCLLSMRRKLISFFFISQVLINLLQKIAW